MKRNLLLSVLVLLSTAIGSGCQVAAKSPTGWSAIVLPTGTYRDCIKATPIEQRPGRLFHVYGNSVRLVDQYSSVRQSHPVRQVLIGTPSLISELRNR